MAISDLNLCRLAVCGRLVRDPHIHTTKTGKTICLFTVCYNPRNGRGILFNFIAFRDLCEYIAENFQKGDYIRVSEANNVEASDFPSKTEPNATVKRDIWKVKTVELVGGDDINQETFTSEKDDIPF